MDTAPLPLPGHLPPLPLPSGLDQVHITEAKVRGCMGKSNQSGLGFGLETSGATLAGEEGGWEDAMPTWVMIEEVKEEEHTHTHAQTYRNHTHLSLWLRAGKCHLGGCVNCVCFM